MAQRSTGGEVPLANVRTAVAKLEHDLAQRGTPQRAVSAKAYLKSDLQFLGVAMPHIRQVCQEFTTATAVGRDDLLRLAAALWKRPYFECRALAVALLERRQKLLTAIDLKLLEQLTRASKTWALSDWIAIHIVGPILQREPAQIKHLDRWAQDDDFWVRRLALICQRDAFSKGSGDWPGFVRRADGMLEEKEFFLRKAIGWMLRERSKVAPDDVVAFVRPRRARMAGSTFREATRNLPAGHRGLLDLD